MSLVTPWQTSQFAAVDRQYVCQYYAGGYRCVQEKNEERETNDRYLMYFEI